VKRGWVGWDIKGTLSALLFSLDEGVNGACDKGRALCDGGGAVGFAIIGTW
jgi:hypothetical protein